MVTGETVPDAPDARRSRRRQIIVSVVVGSLVLHLVIGVGAGFWVIARYFTRPPATFEIKKDIRLAAQEREHRMNLAEFDSMSPAPALSEKIASTRPTKIPLPDIPKVPMDQMIPLDPSAIVSDQVSSLIGTAGLGGGKGAGAGGTGTGSAMSFFGIRDTGKSVVIMIDVSDSMFTRTGDYDSAGRRFLRRGGEQSFQVIRDEAIKLIQALGINTRFGLVHWSGGAYAWKPEMVPASDANKLAAIEHIRNGVDAKTAPPKEGRPGGTRHDYALEEAFALKPEVIYMLTDGNATSARPGGGLQPIGASEIWKAAESGQKNLAEKARLHVIYYVTGKDKEDERKMLRGLASRNQGCFKQVEAPRERKSSSDHGGSRRP